MIIRENQFIWDFFLMMMSWGGVMGYIGGDLGWVGLEGVFIGCLIVLEIDISVIDNFIFFFNVCQCRRIFRIKKKES
jgi:hypothetical protein